MAGAEMDASPAKPIESYDDLVQALRSRVAEVNTTFAGLDLLAGLPSNYASKLLAEQPIRGMTAFTLMCLINALGLRLLLVPDADALAKLRLRSDWAPMVRPGPRYRPRKSRPRLTSGQF
jgi:hypothetical protein